MLRVTHLGRKMNGAGSQHGADESGKAGTSTADFNFREEKNHQLFDAEIFFSRFMVRKSFRDILFLLLKQTNVKVISINPLNYKKNI